MLFSGYVPNIAVFLSATRDALCVDCVTVSLPCVDSVTVSLPCVDCVTVSLPCDAVIAFEAVLCVYGLSLCMYGLSLCVYGWSDDDSCSNLVDCLVM